MHIVAAAPSQHTAPTTHTSPKTAILKSKTIGPGINHRSPSTTTNNNKDGKIPIRDDDDDYDTRKDDSQGKRRSLPPIVMTMLASLMSKVQRSCSNWNGNIDFIQAQGQVALVLIVAYIGNNWPYSYPRNDNHNYTMFWSMNMAVLIAAACTMKHVPNTRGIQILSRSQTEEWKGWMQWAFIMVRDERFWFLFHEIIWWFHSLTTSISTLHLSVSLLPCV
jgi:10 TM Acyl Transferase domain found in Cas1p